MIGHELLLKINVLEINGCVSTGKEANVYMRGRFWNSGRPRDLAKMKATQNRSRTPLLLRKELPKLLTQAPAPSRMREVRSTQPEHIRLASFVLQLVLQLRVFGLARLQMAQRLSELGVVRQLC